MTNSNQGDNAAVAEERLSYIMLFCALMLVRRSKASLEDSLRILPLAGSARDLAEELATPTAQ